MQRDSIRFVSLVLCLLMVITMLPTQALATDTWGSYSTSSATPDYATPDENLVASGSWGDNLIWTLDGDGLLTISGTGAMWGLASYPWESYTVKNAVIETGVTSIGSYAFDECKSLTSITIGDSVTSIGDYAFSGCASLTSITIGDSVTSIGNGAFSGCTSLISITIPDSVTSIGNSAFSGCTSLTSLTIPDGVTCIGGWAFQDCYSLSSITIPDSVTSIGYKAFYNCKSLTSITIPDSVTSIGDYAFSSCASLTSITIGDSVTSIGEYAFAWCTSLISVTIPDSVTSIEDYAFYVCESLNHVIYAGTQQQWNEISVGSYNTYLTDSIVHTQCDKMDVTVTDHCTVTVETCNICNAVVQAVSNGGSHRFISGSCSKCGIARMMSYYSISRTGNVTITDCDTALSGELVIPSTIEGCPVTCIGGFAFFECTGLSSITIPDSVTSIENSAFSGCTSLSSITIPDSVTSIGVWAFQSCTSLSSITIPDSVTSIGSAAFRYCSSLTSITIPDSVTSVGDYAFSGCSKLAAVVFPAGVTSVSAGAFQNCNALDHVFYTGTEDQWFAMTVGVDNDYFLDANVHFDSTGEEMEISRGCTHHRISCRICDEVICTWEATGATAAHDYAAAVTAPTCTENGYTTFTCTLCGDSYVGNEVAALGHSYESVVVAPTCTEDGHTTYTCSGCGDNYTTTQEALGHSFTTVVTAPTCTAVGYSCHSCGNCDYVFYDTIRSATGIHVFEDGSCIYGCGTTETVAPEALEFVGATLKLEENLTVLFMVNSSLITTEGYENPYVVCSLNGVTSIIDTYTTSGSYYVFAFEDIAPQQMNDTISATLYATYQGTTYESTVVQYSVSTYCYNTLAKTTNAKLRTLLVDLLNYGTAAQLYTGYKTDALVNANLTETQKAWGTQTQRTLSSVTDAAYTQIESPSVNWKGVGLKLTEAVGMYFVIEAEDASNLSVKIADNDGWIATISGSEFKSAGNGLYYIYFTGLNAGQMSQDVYLTVYEDANPVSNTLRYSIESYACKYQSSPNTELANLLNAMMKYGDSAYAYIN